jgi:hypothetical protein
MSSHVCWVGQNASICPERRRERAARHTRRQRASQAPRSTVKYSRATGDMTYVIRSKS